MEIGIGILGLGHIGEYHLQTLAQFPELKLKAGCDKNSKLKEKLPAGVNFYSKPEKFLKDESFTTVIIATPNQTHFEFGCKAYEAGKNVIMEKPAAGSLAESEDLERRFSSSPDKHIYYAFHAAKALEVNWFKEYLQKKDNNPGELTAFSCSFYDPYFSEGEIKKEALGLQDCWLDSGVNVLSVLEEIYGIEKFNVIEFTETKFKKAEPAVQACCRYSFLGVGNRPVGLGVIDTNWTLGLNQKKTFLVYGKSGILFELDHTNQRVLKQSANGERRVLKDFSKTGERLYNHYIGVFTDYINCIKKGNFNVESARRIHKGLFLR